MNLDLTTFLSWVLMPAGCGAVIFGLIELVDKVTPGGLTGNWKFGLSMILAFLVPLAAYGAQLALGLAVVAPNTFFEVLAVGYMVSQTVHRAAALQAAATPTLVQGTTWTTTVSPVVSVPSPLAVPAIPATGSVTLPTPSTTTVSFTPPPPDPAPEPPAVPHG